MQTVSTLCATTTVGIAACGFALALPHNTNDNLPNLRSTFSTPTPPVLEESVDGISNGAKLTQFAPRSTCSPTPPPTSRPSTGRRDRWIRRLSQSFGSSSPASSPSLLSPSPTLSLTSTSSRNRSWTTSQPNSRPPTRNKLVKRSPAERLSRTNSPVPLPSQTHRRRESAAIIQPPPTCEQSSNPTPPPPHQVSSRPSTSGRESAHFCTSPEPDSVHGWRPFFSKRQQSNESGSGTSKQAKKSIRRIIPDLSIIKRKAAHLVIATAVNSFPETQDSDTNSLQSDPASPTEQRPASMGDMMQTATNQRSMRQHSATQAATFSARGGRKFSLSKFLGGTSPNKSTPREMAGGDDAMNNAYAGIMGSTSYARRHSTFDPRPVPYTTTSRSRRPSTPGLDSDRRDLLPPIQSYPLLESDPDEPVSPGTAQPAVASAEEQVVEGSLNAPANGFSGRRHRLSIMSASEHASTLIGCESEHDFGSDTLFDSLRTRTSENAPVRADRIFDYEPRGPLDTRPMNSIEANGIPIATSSTPAQTEDVDSGDSSLSSSHTAQPSQRQRQASVNLEDDEDGWSGSDWDAPSKSADEDDRLQGLPHRPYSGMFTTDSRVLIGLQQNNTTRDSFSTVREGMSIDESSSILDWNDGVSMHTQNSQSRDYRPKTTHAKESMGTRVGRRAPAYHTRSQSVPVNVKAIPLSDRPIVPSENWDDDFFGDDGDEDCDRNIVVPRAIEESQQSIIGHLGIVREFALLVEELKRLRSVAISKGVRYKVDSDLWDEADAIIALATQDEEEDKSSPLKKEGLRRNTTWSPAQQRRRDRNQQILDDNSSAYTTVSSRHTVLAPDDDIFGGGENTATPRQSRRISPTPSSISRKVIDLNDPVQCSRGLMEKMILRQSQESLRPHCGADGKLCFDTGMLENLVDQTKSIRDRCRISAEGYSQSAPNPTIDRGDRGERSAPLKLKIRPEHQQPDDKFDFDLSPIKSSIPDEDLRLDRVDSRALEFTPVIGVA